MEGLEAKHGARDPFYETVVLFHDVVEVFDLEDRDRAPRACELQDEVDAFQTRQIGTTLVDNDPIRQAIGADCPLEKPPGGCLVAALGEHEIRGFSCIVDGSVIIGPPSLNLDIGFVHAPRYGGRPLPCLGIRGDHGRKFDHPTVIDLSAPSVRLILAGIDAACC